MCPWNVRFARELPDDSPYAARDVLGRKDGRTLAREILGMTQPEFSAAFRGSPMQRAKLRGLTRNAAAVLGNVGTEEGADVLVRTLGDEEPLARELAAWALAREGSRAARPTRRRCPTPGARQHRPAAWRTSGEDLVVGTGTGAPPCPRRGASARR